MKSTNKFVLVQKGGKKLEFEIDKTTALSLDIWYI